MKHLFNTLLFCLLAVSITQAQSLKTTFSEETVLKGKNKGYTDNFIAETKDKLYLKLSQKGDRAIQMIDKKTMRPVKKINLKPKKGGSWYWSYRVIDSGILVLYINKNKKDKKVRDVFASKYDWDLKRQFSYKEVTTYDPRIEDITITAQEGGDKLALLRQKYVEEGDPITLEYQIFDENLEYLNLGQQELDLVSKISLKKARKRNSTIIYKFDYTSGKELVAPLFVSKDSDPQGAYFLEFINVEKNTRSSERIKLENDAFFDYLQLFLDGDEMIVTGFYSDAGEKSKIFSKKKTTYNTSGMDGTFFKRYDVKTKKLLNAHQTPFSDEMLFTINNQNPAKRKQIKKNKKKGNFDDDVSDAYRIRKVLYDDKKKTATFYCEYVNNYSVTTTTRSGNVTTTTTTYYSIRGNLFYFEMSMKDGDINYVNSIRKYQMLSSSSSSIYNFTSMRVVNKGSEDIVLFYSDRMYKERNKDDLKGEAFKTKKLKQNYIAATINKTNGNFDLEYPKMSNTKLKPQQKVQFGTVLMSNYDNTFYTINSGSKLNIPFAVVCGVAVVVGWYVWYLSPGNRSHEVYTISKVEY